jgi:hypothetical protein
MPRILFASLLPLLLVSICFAAAAKEEECVEDDATCNQSSSPPRVPETCGVVYAPLGLGLGIGLLSNDDDDSNSNPNSNNHWAVFSLIDRPKGTPVWNYGDVVIQVPDAPEELLQDFVWDGDETGGHYEGHQRVRSVVPGLGMMAQTKKNTQQANLLPFVPRLDEGGLTRFDSPGAGAISHYHNYTWFIRESVQAGDQLVTSAALRVNAKDNDNSDDSDQETPTPSKKPTLDELKETGYCLDNVRPRKSRIKEAGRGAFATRHIQKGTLIAPVPVAPISSSALKMDKAKSQQQQQLLRNYCFGHPNATTLLYPYGPMINLINHYTKPNVKLQWSEQSQALLSRPLPQDNEAETPFLLMELVATRELKEGEELYLNYGRDWEEAWFKHTQAWKPSDMHYTPSYVMDDAIQLLRTQQEQKEHEYPDSAFTSCFYRYSDRTDDEKALQQQPSSASSKAVTSFSWKFTKRLYDLKHLRPCQVLRRNEDAKGRSGYAVRMLNRPGLPDEEVIPKGALHVVTHVPRQAIRFSDKPGMTDQHLAGAFRHELALVGDDGDDDLFPKAWRDLEPLQDEL